MIRHNPKACVSQRRFWQLGFLLLFIITPLLDWFRLDLNLGHFILFGQDWKLNLTALQNASTVQLIWRLLWVALLPLLLTVVVFLFIAWRWGRLYCGWLCPHFLAVESINQLMKRATGKLSLWDRKTIPQQQMDGTHYRQHPFWWLPTFMAIMLFAFAWALIAITYLLPPDEVYHNLINGQLTRHQMLFLSVVSGVFMIEFTFARHLFCRYACAVGVFQSLAWMANKRALVVGFNGSRAKACASCDKSCEHACPMRLKPRTIKRNMFTCTQCTACVDACTQVQLNLHQPGLLNMLDGDCALDKSQRDFGRKAQIPPSCFEQ
ncbi:4Fe-4S binding protein [Marinicella sediminis]|uniref:4Fe-4S binding protein n=1 Tax=Marinicella sediminis TaxID=1792834 RepID=A0ABV7JCR8_9GAMM|nr:4Fe-4S binding protein [Marinicella sediminis]